MNRFHESYVILERVSGLQSMSPLFETMEERITRWIVIAVICLFFAGCLSWALLVILRYYSIQQAIRRRMKWSYNNDVFWNYDNLIYLSKEAYTKAQTFLNSINTGSLPFLSEYGKARLGQIKRKISSEQDLRFLNSYIVSFRDKKDDAQDELKVYFEIKNKRSRRNYKELVVLRRNGDSLVITDMIKNPTMFMITHSRTIIEK